MIRPRRPVLSDEVRSHYDDLDPFYRAVWGDGLHHGLWTGKGQTPEEAVRSMVEAIGLEADLRRGQRVLDVGCGYGQPARILASRFGVGVTGLTLSDRQAEIARKAGASLEPAPEFRVEDFLEGPLPPEAFDAVVALESTAHMDDKAGFFRRAERTLVRGGRLVVAAWTASVDASPRESRWLLEPICRHGRLPGLGTATEYEGWCRTAGLEVLSVRDLTAQVRHTWTVVLRRLPFRLLPRASTWRYLLDPASRHRDFLLVIPLIWTAQRQGSLRYTVLSARKNPRS